MDDKIKAPFTAEQVAALNRWQKDGRFHPFTCGGDRKDAAHLDGEGILVATPEGWKCPYCDYTQDWAHAMMAHQILKEGASNFPGDQCIGPKGHCSFEIVSVEKEAVTIRDLDMGGKSVTNDAEYVVEQLRMSLILLAGRKLYYFDSDNNLDEIVWEGVAEIGFRPGPGRVAP